MESCTYKNNFTLLYQLALPYHLDSEKFLKPNLLSLKTPRTKVLVRHIVWALHPITHWTGSLRLEYEGSVLRFVVDPLCGSISPYCHRTNHLLKVTNRKP